MTDIAVRQSSAATQFYDEWDRLPAEPARAFAAFVIFRDQGTERGNVTSVREKAGGIYSHKSVLAWAERWRWVERALAYDRMIDRKRVAAHAAAVEEMARRQVEMGQTLQGTGLAYVAETLDTKEKRAEHLTPTAALRFVKTGVEMERQGLGMDDDEKLADLNVQINVLDAGTKGDLFAKIGEMAANMAAVKAMTSGPAPVPPDIVDADVVEDDGEGAGDE